VKLVRRVIDGDTIDVDHLNKKFTVRLVSIDAAELGKGKYEQSQPFARAAEKHLTGLVSNRESTPCVCRVCSWL
jgi:endonuclease YncB( thermonuclease family)